MAMIKARRKKKKGSKRMLYIAISFFLLGIVSLIVYSLQTYKPGKLTISAPFSLGSYEFDRASLSEQELNIAWKLYVQLTTRKAAIPIDEDNDIIVEIYDSWYELFKTTRDYLLKCQPVSSKEMRMHKRSLGFL
ncbi:hypothetical protein D3C78_1367960 [compost metagenome]